MMDFTNQIAHLWSQIVAQFDDPSVCNPGASATQLKRLGQFVGRKVPESFRSLLTTCNGLNHDGYKYLSPTPLGTEQLSRTIEQRSKLNIKSSRPNIFDPSSMDSQAFGTWPKQLLEISSCDDMGHAIELDTGRIFFYDYVEGGHVKFQFHSLLELLEKTLELFSDGQQGLYGGLITSTS